MEVTPMTINIKKRFGISVQQLRINMGLSQEKFALKISMDRSYFASVELLMRILTLIFYKNATMI